MFYDPNLVVSAPSAACDHSPLLLRLDQDRLSFGRYRLSHLTMLDIDTAGTPLLVSLPSWGGVHLCSIINALLPTLRRLRCRMCKVCDALLEPPEGNAWLGLEEVIVNLSLSDTAAGGEDTSFTFHRYPMGCWPIEMQIFSQLQSSVERQARRLALRLDSPKMVRVLSHNFPALKTYAYDALTEQRIQLAENAPWDADRDVGADDEAVDSETDLFEHDSSEEEDGDV
jgi:hypothetical protein